MSGFDPRFTITNRTTDALTQIERSLTLPARFFWSINGLPKCTLLTS